LIALVLNILLSVVFFHVIRSAQVRGRNMMVVAAVNYVLASPLCLVLSAVQGNTALSFPTLVWGAAQGVAFIVTYVLICAAMAQSGLGISTAFVRLAVVIPVAASVLWWGETPTPGQAMGIVACLASLPMVGTQPRNAPQRHGTQTRGSRWRVVLLVGGMGAAGVAAKAFVEADTGDAPTTYMGVLYGVAFLGSLGFLSLPAWRTQWSGVRDGLRLGLVNVAAILTHLVALEQVAGTVVFPVQAAGGLVLSALFAAAVWKERFGNRTLVGMGLAAVGLAMVNIG